MGGVKVSNYLFSFVSGLTLLNSVIFCVSSLVHVIFYALVINRLLYIGPYNDTLPSIGKL